MKHEASQMTIVFHPSSLRTSILGGLIMSRIGKKVITLPKGVSVTIQEQQLEVKGPKGTLKTPIPAGISFKLEGDELRAERTSDDLAPLHGLARALANNAIVGVTEGFTQQMDVVGVGYKADVQSKKIVFSLGYSHPIEFPLARRRRSQGRAYDHQGKHSAVSNDA